MDPWEKLIIEANMRTSELGPIVIILLTLRGGVSPIGIKLRVAHVAHKGFATPILGRIMLKSRC